MDDGKKRSQLRLVPYIIDALNSERFFSLKWYDRNKRIFRLSWPHKSAKHWTTECARFFEEWAMYKGKLRDGQVPDHKKLKSNFRCALNSKQELQEIVALRTKKFRYWQISSARNQQADYVVRKRVKSKLSFVQHNTQMTKKRGSTKKEVAPRKLETVRSTLNPMENRSEQMSPPCLPSIELFRQQLLHQRALSGESAPTSNTPIPRYSYGTALGASYAERQACQTPALCLSQEPFYSGSDAVSSICEENVIFENEDLESLNHIFRDFLNLPNGMPRECNLLGYRDSYQSNSSTSNDSYGSNTNRTSYLNNSEGSNASNGPNCRRDDNISHREGTYFLSELLNETY